MLIIVIVKIVMLMTIINSVVTPYPCHVCMQGEASLQTRVFSISVLTSMHAFKHAYTYMAKSMSVAKSMHPND